MSIDFSRHPCFNDAVRHRYGRVHLPVAPHCNVQCNFCDRDFSCVNESRPGVTTTLLSPHQAIAYLEQVIQRDDRISVVGIAGPGDPFANAEATLETLALVRQRYPQMMLCVASNGLAVLPHVTELARLAVSHVTLTVNAVDAAVGARIYAWVRDGKIPYRGTEGAELLLSRQLAAIQQLKANGLIVKINTIVIPGVNDHHIADVARSMQELGADILNCVPMYRVEQTPFADLGEPSPALMAEVREVAGQYLPLMHHCTRCRADAAGTLGEPVTQAIQEELIAAARLPLVPTDDRPYVAVASLEGILVNQHLGEAQQLEIYAMSAGEFAWIESRQAPDPGGGSARWEQLADSLLDCRALLVSSAGPAPCEVLKQRGIRVIMMEGLIEEGLAAVFSNRPLRAPLRKEHRCGAGAACAGDGRGCL
jgi:nitrogen fixation protein NifB